MSLNTNTKISKDIVQNLLDIELEHSNKVVLWHDDTIVSISRHENNGVRHFQVPHLLAILKLLKNRPNALVWWTASTIERRVLSNN